MHRLTLFNDIRQLFSRLNGETPLDPPFWFSLDFFKIEVRHETC